MPSGLFYINSLDWSISNRRDVRSVLLKVCIIKIPVINANSVEPNQTPRSVASDLDLHCLPMSLLWAARHKWINFQAYTFAQIYWLLDTCLNYLF